MAVNPMEYGSKDVVLDVVRTERSRFYDVIDILFSKLRMISCKKLMFTFIRKVLFETVQAEKLSDVLY